MREVRTHAADELLRAGVSMAHLQVIWQLQCNGGELPMGRLAELLGISVSNATGLIDRMEERGLVERLRPAGDRRSVHVRPTASALKAAEAMELMHTETNETVLDRLDVEQLDRLAAGLTDWIEALEGVIRERAVPHATRARTRGPQS